MYFQSLGKIKKKHSHLPSPDHPNSVSRIRRKGKEGRKKRGENKKVTIEIAIEINSHFREIFLEKYADINININLIIIRVRLLEFNFSI